MKRREALVSLAATAAGVATTPQLVEAFQRGELSEAQVEAWLRSVAKVEPRPGEAEAVRRMVGSLRAPDSDPQIQPAFAFNPEVEP